MGWEREYQRKRTTPDEAVRLVRSGQRVVVPIGSAPLALADALAARLDELEDIEFLHCAALAAYAWLHPVFADRVRVVHEHYAAAPMRRNMLDRVHDFMPMPFSRRFRGEEDGRTREEARPGDVLLVVVSLPDEEGFVYLGGHVWNTHNYIERIPVVLAEVDRRLPRCCGDTRVHVSRFTHFVDGHEPRLAVAATPAPLTEAQRKIADHVAELVRDGDTLQIGAGAASFAVARAGVLEQKRDLGWHSEVTPAAVVRMLREGVVNGSRKTLHPGAAVATSFSFTPDDYEWASDNPGVLVFGCEYIQDPRVIARNENMVAINSALAVDLTGQINSESVGDAVMTGTGGQLEFVMGAVWSKGGRSITVLPSTYTAGEPDAPTNGETRLHSRIVPRLPAGATVTVPRMLTDYVVTEYGIARLFGKSLRERREELIAIAHPELRAELRRQS